jgi:holliday junction DNA helicase RuvA
MIAALTGRIEGRTSDSVILNVGGVSFLVHAPASAVQNCGEIGQTVVLYTHLYVREDALNLYGFLRPAERDFFERLLTVSGIGPKAALSLLSALSLADLETAIARGDVETLTRVPGIGKKTSARLVLELKGKLDLAQVTNGRPAIPPANADVLAALTNLGYPLAAAQEAVQNLPADASLSTGDKIRLALRYLAGR